MSSNEFSLTSWVDELAKNGELSEEEKKGILTALGKPKATEFVKGAVLRQSEFSRRMDGLKTEEERLKADFAKKVADEEKKTLDFSTSVGNWKTEKEKVLQAAVKAREEAETKLTAVQGKIKEIAPTYGIPEDQLSSMMTPVTPTKKDDPPHDPLTGKYVTEESFNKIVKDYAKLPAIITVLEREHMRLFGADAEMPDWMAMVEAGKPLKQSWEEKYKVPERRAAIAKDVHDKEIAEAEKRGAEAARSKFLAENPTTGVVRRDSDVGSPVLAVIKRDNAVREGFKDEGRGVAAAVAAFQNGTYRDKTA